jgi:hypothetical protein
MLKIYGGVVQEVKDEMKRQGREDEFVGSRVLRQPHSVCALCPLTFAFSQRSFIPPSRLLHRRNSNGTRKIAWLSRRSSLI